MSIKRMYCKWRYGRPLIVVSGLPRSGTSMVMQMLAAGGLSTHTDEVRVADDDNPKGYFEYERIKNLHDEQNKDWLRPLKGKVVKIISQLLKALPDDLNYQVIFMRRDLDEVLASQSKMLDNRGESHDHVDDQTMKENFERHLWQIRYFLNRKPNFATHCVNYRDVIESPRSEAEKINQFLGDQLDVDAMVNVVDRKLYRNRKAELEVAVPG